MQFLDDIIYDRNYDTATKLARILYQPDQQSPFIAIQLSDTTPFKFIHFFDDFIQCHNYIRQNVRKQFTLFISSINIIDARDLLNNNQLCHVYVFCMLPEHISFLSRYLQAVRHKVRKVFMHDKLEYELLLHGVDHCNEVADELRDNDRGIADMALRDGRRLSQALADYFMAQIEKPDNRPPKQSTT